MNTERQRQRDALTFELNVTCQDYNHVFTVLENTVLGDIFKFQNKNKRFEGQSEFTNAGKDKENLPVVHSMSRGGRSSFMHSSLLKEIPSGSVLKRPLGFPFCL